MREGGETLHQPQPDRLGAPGFSRRHAEILSARQQVRLDEALRRCRKSSVDGHPHGVALMPGADDESLDVDGARARVGWYGDRGITLIEGRSIHGQQRIHSVWPILRHEHRALAPHWLRDLG
jgi:hypothetical protein